MTSYLTSFLFIVFIGNLSANEDVSVYYDKKVMSSKLDSLNASIELTQSSYELIIQKKHPWITKACNALNHRKSEAEQLVADTEIYDARLSSASWSHNL